MRNIDFYKCLFRDICVGSSKVVLDGSVFYVKHPSFNCHIEMEVVREESLKKSIKAGILTRDGYIKVLKESEAYPDDIEKEILSLKSEIEDSVSFSKTQIKKIIKDRERIKVKNIRAKIKFLESKIEEFIIRDTADYIANTRSIEGFLISSLFYDEGCENKVYEGSKELDSYDLNRLIVKYFEIADNFERDSIEEMVLQPFFRIYSQYCSKPLDFFGKPVTSLSQNQLFTLHYGEYFKNIFANYEGGIPEEIATDPRAIINFIDGANYQKEMSEKSDGRMSKNTDSNFVVSTKFGASQEDYEDSGVGGNMLDLSELTGENGGTLDTEDIMLALTKQSGLK